MSSTDDVNDPLSAATLGRPPTERDSIDSLRAEAETAHAAAANKLHDLKQSLQTAADPRVWAREHPWIALGIAAASGFTAAKVMTGGRGEPAASAGHSPADPQSAPSANASAAAPANASATWMPIVFDLAKVLITTQVLPLVQAWQQKAASQKEAAAQKERQESPQKPRSPDTAPLHNGREAASDSQ